MRSLVFLLCGTAFAQQYDVATVKVSQAQVNVSMLANPRANPFRATNATLLELVRLAYETSFVTGPDWLGTARYDIVANAPAGANPEEGPVRLRALLEERLGVKVHREKGERNVYALEAPRGAEKLAFDPDKKPEFPAGNNAFLLLNGDMRQWTEALSRMVDRPVIDRTGLKGTFRHMLAYGSGDDSTLAGIYTSLTEQTGLRMTATKAEVEIIVVDNANRTPTEN